MVSSEMPEEHVKACVFENTVGLEYEILVLRHFALGFKISPCFEGVHVFGVARGSRQGLSPCSAGNCNTGRGGKKDFAPELPLRKFLLFQGHKLSPACLPHIVDQFTPPVMPRCVISSA